MSITRHSRGFTLVDIMVTVTVIAILAAMVIPMYRTEQTRTRVAAMCTNLRSVTSAFEVEISEEGLLPAKSGPDMPERLESHFTQGSWQKLWEPVDGTYWGLYNAKLWGSQKNYIVLQSDAGTLDVWTEVDQTMDDGERAGGKIRIFPVGTAVYTIYIVSSG